MILLDVENDIKISWALALVGKSIEHVYLTNGKREIYHGNVLKFDDKTTNLQIKYKGYKKNSNNNILEMYNDFINGDLTICE